LAQVLELLSMRDACLGVCDPPWEVFAIVGVVARAVCVIENLYIEAG
jgi:hypothetical protein